MPIYAYRCATCGNAKDVLQKMSDPVLTVCPFCGAATFEKQVTAAGFQLKGSGWYVTDFRGDKPTGTGAAEAKTDGAGKSEGGKPDGGKPGAGADSGKTDSAQTDSGKRESSAPAATKSAGSASPAPAPAPAASPAPSSDKK